MNTGPLWTVKMVMVVVDVGGEDGVGVKSQGLLHPCARAAGGIYLRNERGEQREEEGEPSCHAAAAPFGLGWGGSRFSSLYSPTSSYSKGCKN